MLGPHVLYSWDQQATYTAVLKVEYSLNRLLNECLPRETIAGNETIFLQLLFVLFECQMSYNGKINSDMELNEYCIFAKKKCAKSKAKIFQERACTTFLNYISYIQLKKNG